MRATIVDAINDTIKAIPSEPSRRPSIPCRKKSGRKLAMMIREELNIGILTSRDAS